MTAPTLHRVVMHDLPRAFADASAPLVVLISPGASLDAVDADAAQHGTVPARVRAVRSDRSTPGALMSRLGSGEGLPPLLVCAELQWADDESLSSLVAIAAALVDAPSPSTRDRLVLAWRAGSQRQRLAELLLLARRAGSVIEVVPDDVETLTARGIDPMLAVDLIADTGGLPDLIAELRRAGALTGEVVARLAVLDPVARTAAELLAFGVDTRSLVSPDLLAGARPHASLDTVDRCIVELTVEGLLVEDRMPRAVAAEVRSACPPARRDRVIAAIVEHGPPGQLGDLAMVLLQLGDRSPSAVPVYVATADALAADDPATALRLVRAAADAGARPADVAQVAAIAQVGLGRPFDALRGLDGLDGADVELVRAAAWAALGDLAAAASALARSEWPQLADWAAIGSGVPRAAGPRPAVAGASEGMGSQTAGLLVAAIEAWVGGSFGSSEALLERLALASRLHRGGTDAGRWPVSPDAVHALVATRLGANDVAQRVAAQAVAERSSGERHHCTHHLLAAWLDARSGLLDAASAVLGSVDDPSPHGRFLREAARCAVAVRDVDGADVDVVLAAARAALGAISVSLYDLDLLAEVVAAAARARARGTADPFERVEAIVESLGDPVHLRFDIAWCRLRAAMAGDDLESITACAGALLDLGPAVGAHLLADEIRSVAEVLASPAEGVDTAIVIELARRLADHGAAHEAARLCGLVAMVSTDDGVARRLLRESRAWRATRARLRASVGDDRSVVRLSEQELRIAQMVLAGHTHKQIGAALYVAPKTVEHHVAHIRTKLGCGTRAELMAALRDYLASAAA